MTTPVFDLEKSIQAILFIANRLERKDFHKIFKILYFADREHLSQYGRTITGDTYVAMKDGPVPSKIDDIFKAVRGDSFFTEYAGEYHKYFNVHNWYFIHPNMDANLDCLSESDVEMLTGSLKKYGSLSWDEIREKSHDYAWRATPSNGQISLEDILRESGDSEDYIEFINEQIALQKACI
ncbi:MAG: SocA family protein [Tannerella sp.]|nr:SocA family protein [Tannerella sp.]